MQEGGCNKLVRPGNCSAFRRHETQCPVADEWMLPYYDPVTGPRNNGPTPTPCHQGIHAVPDSDSDAFKKFAIGQPVAQASLAFDAAGKILAERVWSALHGPDATT